MKIKYFYIWIVFIVILSCSCDRNKKRNQLFNGINSKMLDLVDSVYNKEVDDENFVTFCCYSHNDTTYLSVGKGLSYLMDCGSLRISECTHFVGYKKYNDLYLVFYDLGNNSFIQNYVEKDSLLIDEYPFEHYKVYDISSKTGDATKICQKNYRVGENGNLIFVNNGWPLPY